MKAIYIKRENQTLFLQNNSGESEIVLIFPITRSDESSRKNWQEVLEFFEKSSIKILLVLDKTDMSTAADYFMSKFELTDRQLFVLPRSIKDTLFDTVGEIVLDENMWIIQLHDDDHWSGSITLPESATPETVYFSDFFLYSQSKGSVQITDYSMPNRIVFSLVPTIIWNRFSKLIQDQKFHVAGSFDFTLNMMAQLACKFEYHPGFKYYWKDDNWDTPRNAIVHLTQLAKSDGWEGWSSPEIANFNRSIDTLSSLNFVTDLLDTRQIKETVANFITGLKPSKKKKLKYAVIIPALSAAIRYQKIVGSNGRVNDKKLLKLQERLSLYKFIKETWSIKSIENVIGVVTSLESLGSFEFLQNRFRSWKKTLTGLMEDL